MSAEREEMTPMMIGHDLELAAPLPCHSGVPETTWRGFRPCFEKTPFALGLVERDGDRYDIAKALQEKVLCQGRMNDYKQYVIMDGHFIVKGPYLKERFDKILRRFRLLSQWRAEYLVFPACTTLVALPEATPTKGEKPTQMLVYEDVAFDYRGDLAISRKEEKDVSYSYVSARADGLVKILAAWKKKTCQWASEAVPGMVRTLVLLFVLGVGDVHLANILVDTRAQRAYVVDIDEERGNNREVWGSDLFYFCILNRREIVDKYWRPFTNPRVAQSIMDSLNDVLRQSSAELLPEELERGRHALHILKCVAERVPLPDPWNPAVKTLLPGDDAPVSKAAVEAAGGDAADAGPAPAAKKEKRKEKRKRHESTAGLAPTTKRAKR